MEDDSPDELIALFNEPEGFYKPEKQATETTYRLLSGQQLTLSLIGHNPLWGHLLWNGGRIVSKYLEEHAAQLVHRRNVLEFGAGAGLPSLVCALHGAKKVVVTDYSDFDLVQNLRQNFKRYGCHNVAVEGYVWGYPVESLLNHLGSPEDGFDLLILADLLFNHSEHDKLIKSVRETLSKAKDARALVFFTPYRTHLLEKDLSFFEHADQSGFIVEKILEEVLDQAMPDDDPDDELVRTVFGYQLQIRSNQIQV